MAAGTGRVRIVGGGPGPSDLLTLAAARALREADVVLYDRLGPVDRLPELAPQAQLIDVGKRPGHHPIPQERIEAMLVEHARAGRDVVRLKGGDPYVLGRGAEEVLACRAAGVRVEVIPGVSSAFAVPAEAGIPLTHREVSRMFTVVSGHAPLSDDELTHLAGLPGTIVVLMGVATLPATVYGLLRQGARPGLPIAILERGYRPDARVTAGTLATIVEQAAAGVRSPAVIVIGEVVRLLDAPADGAGEQLELIRTLAASG
jgi:uroporphyrin-III C-methyltransferase